MVWRSACLPWSGFKSIGPARSTVPSPPCSPPPCPVLTLVLGSSCEHPGCTGPVAAELVLKLLQQLCLLPAACQHAWWHGKAGDGSGRVPQGLLCCPWTCSCVPAAALGKALILLNPYV